MRNEKHLGLVKITAMVAIGLFAFCHGGLSTAAQGLSSFNTSSPRSGIPQNPSSAHVQIELLSDKAAVHSGEKITIALRQRIAPGWHTYWVNPGDSGEPTHIDWQLPSGAYAGPIRWPLPKALPVGPLMNYGYSDEVVLLSELTVLDNALGPNFDIRANVSWLVCSEICVPESAPASLSLPLFDGGVSTRPSPHAGLIAEAWKKIPQPTPWPAEYGVSGDDDSRVTIKLSGVADKVPEGADVRFCG